MMREDPRPAPNGRKGVQWKAVEPTFKAIGDRPLARAACVWGTFRSAIYSAPVITHSALRVPCSGACAAWFVTSKCARRFRVCGKGKKDGKIIVFCGVRWGRVASFSLLRRTSNLAGKLGSWVFPTFPRGGVQLEQQEDTARPVQWPAKKAWALPGDCRT